MYSITIIIAFFLASGLGSPIFEHEGVVKSEYARLKTLMDAFLRWAAQDDVTSLEHGHLLSQNLKGVTLDSDLLSAKIYVSYLNFVRITEARKVVDHYKVDPKTLATTFRIRMPKIEEVYRYKINGTILSHKVSGAGLLTYSSKDVILSVSDLKFHDSPHNLQIASMKVEVDINNLVINFTGLRVAGMQVDAFERVLQARILSLLKETFHISEFKSIRLEANIDTMMHGKSLEQIVQWLKKHTKNTSDDDLALDYH